MTSAANLAGPVQRETVRVPPLRVVHLVRSLEVGGLERVVCDLVGLKQNLETNVVCLLTLGPLGEALRAQGVPVQVLGMRGGKLLTLARLAACLRSLRPQVLHCHNLIAHMYGGLVRRFCRIPHMVLTKHGAYPPTGLVTGPLNRWLLQRTHIVAVSPEIQTVMAGLRRPGVPGSLRYIPNGISLVPYADLPPRAQARSRYGWSANSFLAVIVARLNEEKNHLGLLHAFDQVRQAAPQARLIVIGDGPMRPAIEESIRQRGLTDAVELLGERHDVPDLLAAMDAFVLSSATEGIPLTVLEAMAAGLPVVATAVGGIPQVVLAEETGCLVPPGSPEALAAALGRLIDDPALAQRLGDAGRQRVQEHFSLQRMAADYESLYRQLVNGHE
jgi:glycosyltransferase involved in cell wall biosynthesis